ncbi:MAG: ABC transporter ATP-binding protein/permease, partial [Desulfobulbaceae bacterium]|nr:ABC transporter ATP-binding protein/permease [Desulfobulbaceae bacterium]
VEKNRLVQLVGHMLRLEMDYYSTVQVGALNGKIHRSIEGLVRIIKLLFLDFFPTGIAAIIAVGIAIAKLPLLGGIMALAIPVGFLICLWQIGSQEGIRIALLRDKEAIDGKVVELLSGIESVRASNTESYEAERVDVLAEGLRKKEIRHHISMALFDCVKYLNEGTFHIAVIATSVYLATRGVITTGDILTYSLLFMSAVTPLREIHRILDEAHESSLRVHDLHELCAQSIDPSYSVKPAKVVKMVRKDDKKNIPAVRISNLSYAYGNAQLGKKVAVLEGINLEVGRGEVLGVAGPSGCGKSTLLKIILGLYHVGNEHVSLDGMAIEDLAREEVAKCIGYVSQSPFMFSGTIRDNIAYGCSDVNEDDIHEACRRACIHDEIIQSLGGYNGSVAERGQNLSGGQRQRLAIARIILRRPSIVLLDEATAALDNLNEKAVQKGLEELMNGRTVIVVAHRLTTLRKADRIIVLNKGRIVETGTYSNLQNGDGLFAELEHAVAG